MWIRLLWKLLFALLRRRNRRVITPRIYVRIFKCTFFFIQKIFTICRVCMVIIGILFHLVGNDWDVTQKKGQISRLIYEVKSFEYNNVSVHNSPNAYFADWLHFNCTFLYMNVFCVAARSAVFGSVRTRGGTHRSRRKRFWYPAKNKRESFSFSLVVGESLEYLSKTDN